MRINKTINGEKYNFYVQFILNTMKANVRYFQSDEWTECKLTNDFKYIILPKGKFCFNGKNIEKLKLTKKNILDAMDYN